MRIPTTLLLILSLAFPIRADDIQKPDQLVANSWSTAYESLKLVRDLGIYSFFIAWNGYVLHKPHHQRNIVDYAVAAVLPALLNYNRDPLTAAVLASSYSFMHTSLPAALADGAIMGSLTAGTMSILWIYMVLDVLLASSKLMPFRQKIIVINETGEPLSVWADTPCDGSDEVWRVPYTLSATTEPQDVNLSSWRWQAKKKNKLQQEIACFPRYTFPTEGRWWPYPAVEHIRFMIVDAGGKKTKSDSCLLPLNYARVLGAYPVYIVRKNGNNLELYLKPLMYQMLKARWFDTGSSPITFPYINQLLPAAFSKIIKALLESTLTEQRIDPVRSCKL